MDAFILDMPLSIVYAAHDCLRHGIDVRFVDQRALGSRWKDTLLESIDDNTVLVGFSVMTGNPIRNALEATGYVKRHKPGVVTVWGGIHVTICPDEVVAESSIDYIIRGLGSKSLYELVDYLSNPGSGAGDRTKIEGLGWMEKGEKRFNPMSTVASYPELNELAIDKLDMKSYVRFNYQENVYSLFTSFGCPHKCKFCYAPLFWKDIKGKKWFPYEAQTVVDHIVEVVNKYNIGYISLLDENFFLDTKRAHTILSGVSLRGVKVGWGIRGVRIDDLDRMDDEFLALMSDIGVRQMMIGAESGSPRILELMKKGITVEQTIRVNRKLASYPNLHPSYNFLSGLPGETIDDMCRSVDLIMRLMQDNPHASFSGMNQLIPFPGSELFDMCIKNGYKEPKSLEGWANVDSHYGKNGVPWLDRKTQDTLHSIQAALMFADKKHERELIHDAPIDDAAMISQKGGDSGGSGDSGGGRGKKINFLFHAILLSARLYRPIALYRLNRRMFGFPIEYKLINFISSIIGKMSK
jgi:radical SAM superfamily enzyme YgiQ (UPF0313 family)